jgi:hypothetical protein
VAQAERNSLRQRRTAEASARLTAGRDASEIRNTVAQSLDRLEAHLTAERLRGYDPYDALSSPIFRLPVLRSAKWPRIAAEQAFKWSPLNFRAVLGVPKGHNPVSVAFILEASAYRAHVDRERTNFYRECAAECIAELAQLRTEGYSGDCWGYPFDWEARYGRLPAGTPTIVATGIVSNSLFVAYRLLGLEDAFAMCESAARFVVEDLPRTEGTDGTFCWGYFPGDTQRVLNATMKGARLCAQVSSVTGDDRYLRLAIQTAGFVANHQREDGSWPYAVGDTRQWADNFHTAYVLDAFDWFEHCSRDSTFSDVKQRGWKYYRGNFFLNDQIPKYYPNEVYPIDATACAQSLLTLCRFGDVDTAARVAEWTVREMQCPDGHFAYQVRRRHVVRIPYMRWSSAYMYVGLSRLAWALANPAAAI